MPFDISNFLELARMVVVYTIIAAIALLDIQVEIVEWATPMRGKWVYLPAVVAWILCLYAMLRMGLVVAAGTSVPASSLSSLYSQLRGFIDDPTLNIMISYRLDCVLSTIPAMFKSFAVCVLICVSFLVQCIYFVVCFPRTFICLIAAYMYVSKLQN